MKFTKRETTITPIALCKVTITESALKLIERFEFSGKGDRWAAAHIRAGRQSNCMIRVYNPNSFGVGSNRWMRIRNRIWGDHKNYQVIFSNLTFPDGPKAGQMIYPDEDNPLLTPTVEGIMACPNMELRMFLLDLLGNEWLAGQGLPLISETDKGKLWEFNSYNLLEVECPSTAKHHFLRVPSRIACVETAIAWTFGMDKEDYQPTQEA